jgi:hypothetical protein
MHTRQLDMIMGNRARVNYYRSKIMSEIHDLVHSWEGGPGSAREERSLDRALMV